MTFRRDDQSDAMMKENSPICAQAHADAQRGAVSLPPKNAPRRAGQHCLPMIDGERDDGGWVASKRSSSLGSIQRGR